MSCVDLMYQFYSPYFPYKPSVDDAQVSPYMMNSEGWWQTLQIYQLCVWCVCVCVCVCVRACVRACARARVMQNNAHTQLTRGIHSCENNAPNVDFMYLFFYSHARRELPLTIRVFVAVFK